MLSALIKFAADTSCTGQGFCTDLPKAGATSANLHALLQVLFGIFGALAVLMIVVASLNFINGEGDPQKVARARNTIIYALVGLVVALSAEIIVTFVLGKF
jgi:hypothetical protein